MSLSVELRAFVDAALAYRDNASEESARSLLHSPFSGVPQEIGLAIAAGAAANAAVLDAMSDPKHALPSADRESVFRFLQRVRELRSGQPLEQAGILSLFEIHVPDQEPAPVAGSLHFREPAPAEAAAPVQPRHGHFSASSLNTYVECKRKWYYRYVCAAVEDKGSSASFYGTAFHAALEQLHNEFPRPAEQSPQTLRMKLEGHLNRAFDRYASGFETPIELDLQRRRARRTAARYIDWLAAQAARAPFTVVGCELPAQLALEGYDFIGYIDRLDRDDATGNVSVIDYKTGSIAKTAHDYREKIKRFEDFQLPFYYWARTAAGDRVTRLALLPLKDALLEVAPVSLEVIPVPREAARSSGTSGVISIAELEHARARMIELCREISAGTIEHFEVTADPAACRYCAYALACNDRPSDEQERFGR